MKLRLILLAAMALICSGAASAETTYTFNQASDAFQAGAPKILSVNCPDGFRATGGGYNTTEFQYPIQFVTTLQSAPGGGVSWFTGKAIVANLAVQLDQPTNGNGDGWAIGGVANKDTIVTVFVMCSSRS